MTDKTTEASPLGMIPIVVISGFLILFLIQKDDWQEDIANVPKERLTNFQAYKSQMTSKIVDSTFVKDDELETHGVTPEQRYRAVMALQTVGIPMPDGIGKEMQLTAYATLA